MAGKNKATGWVIGILVAVVVIVLVVRAIRPKEDVVEEYQPIEEFAEAFDAITAEEKVVAEKGKESYDLEKTVRVINGLEVAQSRLGSFDDFLEYMARQDYSGVPKEVLDTKVTLMPVLQRMYLLQKEHDDLNLWTSLVQKLSNDVLDGAGKDVAVGSLAGDPGISSLLLVNRTVDYIFDQYQKEQKLKGELQKQIQEIRLQYYNYLESFMPIYVKYMTEWDRLCIDRDKAYIDLYNNQPEQVVADCEKVLANYPDNRETMLLKALGLIQIGKEKAVNKMAFELEGDSLTANPKNEYFERAEAMISRYVELYPDQSAPVLLLEGLVKEYEGECAQAISLYDQSSVEYPRQAERLLDMFDSYRVRTYLNRSREGSYLLNLYKSTMAGFGFFSPNLIKAMHYDSQGDYENCSKEIYNHFFRRSNQGTHDGLLLDMQFCEEYLPNSFNRLLPEKNYYNLTIEKRSKMLGLSSDDYAIDVTVDNQADVDLVNLRVFLCIHFTDMYPGDYYVVKIPTINRIPVRSNVKVEDVSIDCQGKKFGDISKVRAIAMTDDKICWIDNVYNKTDNVDYNDAHSFNYQRISAELDSSAVVSRDSYLASIRMSDELFKNSILKNARVNAVEKKNMLVMKKEYVEVELPREVIFLNPSFTWNQTLQPVENYLKGSYVHLSFETTMQDEATLYLISNYLNYEIIIRRYGDRLMVSQVRNLTKEP